MNFKFKYLYQLVTSFLFVSIFSFIAIIVLIGFSQKWFEHKTRYYTYISDSSLINSGTKIRIAGFNVGFVKELNLIKKDKNFKVKVIFYIYNKYKNYMRANSTLSLFKPVVGSPYFELKPSEETIMINPDSYIKVDKENEIMRTALNLLTDLSDNLKPSLKNVNKISNQVLELSWGLKESVEKINFLLNNFNKGKGIIPELLKNKNMTIEIKDIINNTNNVLKQLNTTAQQLGTITKDLPYYTQNINQLVKTTNNLMTNMQTLISNKNIQDFTNLSKQLTALTENITKLSQNMVKITTDINNGKGTLGKVIKSDTIHIELDKLLKNSNKLVSKTDETISKVKQYNVDLGLDYSFNFNENYNYSKIFFLLEPTKKRFYQFGINILSNIDFENNATLFRDKVLTKSDYDKIKLTFDAKLGIQISQSPFNIYGGLIQNNFGAGIIFKFDNKFNFDLLVRNTNTEENLNKISSNLNLNYNIWRKVYSYIGLNDIGNKNEFRLGAKIYLSSFK